MRRRSCAGVGWTEVGRGDAWDGAEPSVAVLIQVRGRFCDSMNTNTHCKFQPFTKCALFSWLADKIFAYSLSRSLSLSLILRTPLSFRLTLCPRPRPRLRVCRRCR
jgi:hypothetical protein